MAHFQGKKVDKDQTKVIQVLERTDKDSKVAIKIILKM